MKISVPFLREENDWNKFFFNEKIVKYLESESCSMCNIKKHIKDFDKYMQNVKFVTRKEFWIFET